MFTFRKNLKNLKEIDLQGSQYLIDIPDFSMAKELERVNLCRCESLRQLHPSILFNSKLKILNLEGCRKIKRLILRSKSLSQKSLSELYLDGCSSLTEILITSDELIRLDLKRVSKLNVNSRSLVDLYLYDRSSLKEISVVSEEVTKLHLSGSAISSFSSISSLPKCTYLDLSDCKEIERLDLHLKSLRELVLNGCSSLKEISVVSEKELYLFTLLSCDCKEIERLDLQSKSPRELVLNGCSSLKEISVISNELKRLKLCGSAITSLLSISSLPKLTKLELSDCKEIERLDLQSKSLRELVLNGCSSLKEIKVISDELKRLKLCGSAITSFSSISSIPKLTYLDLSYCIEIERLDLQPKSLRELVLNGCSSLKEISVISNELKRLKLCGSAITSLLSISSPKLTNLELSDCKKIERLDLQSKSLREFVLNGCSSLKEIKVISDELKRLKLCGSAITSLLSISSPKLTDIKLSDCKKIERLDLQSKSLREFVLNGCSSLKEIKVISDELKRLELCGSAITSFSLISSLPKLTYLDLSYCIEIERLELQSKSLRELVLNGCSSLKEISAVSEKITILKLSGTAITSLSSISSLLKLTYLDLSDCKEIERLELHSKTLIVLKLDGCSSLKKILVQSEKISKLELSNCRNLVSLPELPSALYVLNAFNCISLETEISQHLVLQHMLQRTVPYLHGLYFALPEDHVMDKCVFQTADSSLSIPDLAVSGFNGFIYCTILSEGSLSHSHEMSVSIYLNGIELWHTRDGREDYYPAGLITDHVMFWYHHINKFDEISEVFDHSRNVEIKFQLHGEQKSIKGFGVFPCKAFGIGKTQNSVEIVTIMMFQQLEGAAKAKEILDIVMNIYIKTIGEDDYKEVLVDATLLLLWEQSACQHIESDSEIDDDDDDSSHDEKPYRPPQDRTMVVACLPEVAQNMGYAIASYVDKLLLLSVLHQLCAYEMAKRPGLDSEVPLHIVATTPTTIVYVVGFALVRANQTAKFRGREKQICKENVPDYSDRLGNLSVLLYSSSLSVVQELPFLEVSSHIYSGRAACDEAGQVGHVADAEHLF
ncbi:hypothetical protein Fmac_025641 [Flemingia macrophylla]|uniref:Uncharacterized protein n=1 Tax=Flemingia macrophylla TaxID=520843 RepID=A0ABD1LTH1_9FABA